MPRKATTRAASGSGTIRQRKDGRWEARFLAKDGFGRPIRRSVYGETQREVAEKLRAATYEVDTGAYTEPSKLTVSQWLDVWLADYTGDIKPNSRRLYAQQLRLYVIPAIGSVKLTDLSPHMIQRLYNDLTKPHTIATKTKTKDARDIKKDRPGLSPKTIKNVHGILHHALKQALRLGYIRANPADAVTLPRVTKQKVSFVDSPMIPVLLEALEGNKYSGAIRFALFTGLRQGELLGLTWDAVDLESGVITIEKQLQRDREKGGQFHFASLKNDRSRRIQAPPFVLDILKDERRKQAQNRLLYGGAWKNELNLVFTDELGGFIYPNALYRAFKAVCAEIGIPSTRFHDLRHTYAVLALQNGDDVKTVQEAVGHATAAFTLDVYGHVSQRMKQDSADRMQAYFESLSQVR